MPNKFGLCDKQVPAANICSSYIPNRNANTPGFCKLSSMFRCPVSMDKYAVKISNSSLQNYMQCNMLYYYHKVLGFSVYDYAKSAPLKMGSCMDYVIDNEYGKLLGYSRQTEMNAYKVTSQMDDYSWAKVRAIQRALGEFITLDVVNFKGTQCGFNLPLLDYKCRDSIITGKFDALYYDHFLEFKFTSQPNNYLEPFLIASQVGTYFLSDSDLKYCDMMIIQVPQQKFSKNDTFETYENRIYSDILSRPSEYFIGFDRDKRTFGKRYYRNDFDLDEIEKRYRIVISEIREKYKTNTWYMHDKSCSQYGRQCDYKSICESGCVSEGLYYQDLSGVEFVSDAGRKLVDQINSKIDKTAHPYQVAMINPLDITNVIYVDDYRKMKIVKDSDYESEDV